MINYIIHSKDRACQLDLLLQSIEKYGNDQIACAVIYKATTPAFDDGYNKLFENCSKSLLLARREQNFRDDTLDLLIYSPSRLFGFFTDDTVLFRPLRYTSNELYDLMVEQKCKSFSLRNGLNTELQCHYQPIYEKLELLYNKDGIIKWDTSKYRYDRDFGRPMSIDGNFFTYNELVPTLIEFPWKCPRTLDGVNTDYIRPYMMAFDHSIAVNLPLNLTAGGYADNWGHFYQYSLEELNQRFLDGQRIDLDKIDFSNVVSSHQERELFFK